MDLPAAPREASIRHAARIVQRGRQPITPCRETSAAARPPPGSKLIPDRVIALFYRTEGRSVSHCTFLPSRFVEESAGAMTEEYAAIYGRLPSNLGAFLHAPFSLRSGHSPWSRDLPKVDIDHDYWLHNRLLSHDYLQALDRITRRYGRGNCRPDICAYMFPRSQHQHYVVGLRSASFQS